MSDVKPRVKVPSSAAAGEPITIKTLISHVMESGLRKDGDGNLIPQNIINRFTCDFNGVNVVVEKERDLMSVEMIVLAAGTQNFVAKEVGADARACIDLLVDKMERQLTKHKEKLKNHKHSGHSTEAAADTD